MLFNTKMNSHKNTPHLTVGIVGIGSRFHTLSALIAAQLSLRSTPLIAVGHENNISELDRLFPEENTSDLIILITASGIKEPPATITPEFPFDLNECFALFDTNSKKGKGMKRPYFIEEQPRTWRKRDDPHAYKGKRSTRPIKHRH